VALAEPWQIPAPPEVNVAHCKVSPVVDGELKEACWQSAKPIGDFYLWRGDGEQRQVQAVKVVHDGTWLYAAYEIERPHSDVIESTVADHDGNVSADDSVELFIDPGTDGDLYFHYMLSVRNVRAERSCHPKQAALRDMTWNIPWRSATKVTDTGWRAEVAVPLSMLASHGPLEKLRMNLCLNRILITVNYMNVPIAARRECSSWAPVERGFHEPARFGTVKGLAGLKPKPPVLVAAQALKTSSYQADAGGKFAYTVSGMVRSFAEGKGKVRLVLNDKPASGAGETVEQTIDVEGKGEIPFTVRMPVTELGGRVAQLSLCDPETDEVLEAIELRDMANLSLMRTYPRYSYCTTERKAEIVCEIGLPASERQKMTLVAKDAAGKTIAEVKKLEAETLLPVPARKLPTGEHVVTVELQPKEGPVAVSQEVTLLKRAPRPNCEWKIDHANKTLLKNGEPFFPFGIMAIYRGEEDPETAELISKDLAACGFNTVVRWHRTRYTESQDLRRLLDLGQKHGFYIVDRPHAWSYQKGPEKGWKEMTQEEREQWSLGVYRAAMEQLMNHPNLVSYYLADEPGPGLPTAAWLLKMYEHFNKVDGYHPCEILYIPPVPEGKVYTANLDIIGVDPYWTPGGGVGDLGNPNRVGKQTWLARRRADRDLKLAWVTPCAEQFSGTRMRIIAGEEQRVQTYLTLIHGASGLLYFVYPFKHQQTFDAFKQLGEEMKVLGPACAAGRVPQEIDYSPVGFDPINNIYPDVQVALKRNPKGGYILLAANYKPYPVDVSYTVSLLGEKGRVKELFEDREPLAVKAGSFADAMDAMDTRAYAIDGPADLDEAARIAVKINSHRRKTNRYYTKVGISDGRRPGRKNLLRNSGFEQDTIPGMPDYYRDIRTERSALGYRLGDERGDVGWSLDKENPYEGKQSLRISGRFFLIKMIPRVTKPTKFVFSAYVRGEGHIRFYGPRCATRQAFKATPEWQRIHMVHTCTQNITGEHSLIGLSFSRAKTIWIDAMQFEEGTTPTEYEPMEAK